MEYEDGSTYYGGPGKDRQYWYYYCKGNGPNIRCEDIEKAVINRIKAYFKGNEIFKRLVENAVKYGVYESVDQAEIEISTSCSEDALKIKIRNDYDPDFVTKKGEGIGLKNIETRLGIIYKNENLMVINKSNNTFEVSIIFPQED